MRLIDERKKLCHIFWTLSKSRCEECTYRKKGQNDKIKISGFIFMPATWKYASGHKVNSPTSKVQKIWCKQLIGTFMANLLSKQLKCPRTHHSLTTCWAQIIVSSRVSAPLKYWPHPFLPRPLPKNSKSVRPPLWATPWKVWTTWLLPLKWTLVKKSKDSFFKETKDFISNNENKNTFEHWNMNIQL